MNGLALAVVSGGARGAGAETDRANVLVEDDEALGPGGGRHQVLGLELDDADPVDDQALLAERGVEGELERRRDLDARAGLPRIAVLG